MGVLKHCATGFMFYRCMRRNASMLRYARILNNSKKIHRTLYARWSVRARIVRATNSPISMHMAVTDNEYPRTGLLLLYFAAFICSAVFFQLRSDTPPWVDGSPIEYFTGALLWMSSLIALLMAENLFGKTRRSLFWLAISAGLALLALDELFGFHEKAGTFVGDDDHIKVVQWIFAGAAIYWINRFERSSLRTKLVFANGYILHGLYILSDVADGDYFDVSLLSRSQLRTSEEYLELLTLTAYCMGLIFLYAHALRARVTSVQH